MERGRHPAVSLIAPEGTVVNCIRPAPVSIATVGTIQIVNNLSTILLSKMLGASTRYRHRATAVWHGSHAHLETHGLDEAGDFYVAPLTDTFCGAAGARAFRDGVDLGGEIPNVVSRWANVESQELNTPLVYLYRRAVPDSGGPGKFRGGVCHEYAFTPTRTGDHPMGVTLFGKGTRAPMSLGIFGGYPGCNVGYATFRDANITELPSRLDEMEGSSRDDRFWGSVELEPGDVQYVRFMGGGGYGDPIDRDPALVLDDITRGLVTRAAASRVYSVIITADGTSVDEAATDRRRMEIRTERAGVEIDPRFGKRSDVPPSGQPLGEYLQLSRTGETQCTWCGQTIAPADEDWKQHAVSRRLPVDAAGPHRPAVGEFFLVEAICRSCGTLLDTDLVLGDDPPLHDRVTAP